MYDEVADAYGKTVCINNPMHVFPCYLGFDNRVRLVGVVQLKRARNNPDVVENHTGRFWASAVEVGDWVCILGRLRSAFLAAY